MHYLMLRWNHRDQSYKYGVPLISVEPIEEIRAWAWEQGIRYVLRNVRWESDRRKMVALWIGFYNDNDAFAFKMRWG